MSRKCILALLVAASAACTTDGRTPVVECNQIPTDICTHAIELATERVDTPLPPLERTEVVVGCARSKPCPPHIFDSWMEVAFYPTDGSEPIYSGVRQDEVGWPD